MIDLITTISIQAGQDKKKHTSKNTIIFFYAGRPLYNTYYFSIYLGDFYQWWFKEIYHEIDENEWDDVCIDGWGDIMKEMRCMMCMLWCCYSLYGYTYDEKKFLEHMFMNFSGVFLWDIFRYTVWIMDTREQDLQKCLKKLKRHTASLQRLKSFHVIIRWKSATHIQKWRTHIKASNLQCGLPVESSLNRRRVRIHAHTSSSLLLDCSAETSVVWTIGIDLRTCATKPGTS